MTLVQRLRAAADAMLGRVPQQKGQAHPFFWGGFIQNAGMPQSKPELNYRKLRTLSETAIPRRAIRYIKSQVSRLEFGIEVKKGSKVTAKQKKQIEALNNVLRSPNSEDDWRSFCERMVEDMLVLGWSTNVVKEWPEQPDHPFLIFPSDAASFQIYMDWNGSPKMRKYAQFSIRGEQVDFLPDELFVVKYDPRTNDPFGLPPMAVCAQEVEYLLSAMGYAASVASQAHPKKLLHLGEDADMEFTKEVRQYWKDEVEGRGTLPILGGTKAPTSIELGADSDESLFLKWQERLITVVANAFGLDVQKFGVVAGVNRSTGDTLDDVTDESAIRPVASSIENAINNFFLRRMGLYEVAEFQFRFTTSHTDRKALATLHQIMLQDDEITVNEARAEMGYPPLPKDPETEISKGDYTLTEYRARYGSPVALGLGMNLDQGGGDGKDGSRQNDDLKNKGQKGSNGVYGASKPKDKPMNKGKELNTEVPKQ